MISNMPGVDPINTMRIIVEQAMEYRHLCT